MGNIAPGIFRKTLKDVQVNGRYMLSEQFWKKRKLWFNLYFNKSELHNAVGDSMIRVL